MEKTNQFKKDDSWLIKAREKEKILFLKSRIEVQKFFKQPIMNEKD